MLLRERRVARLIVAGALGTALVSAGGCRRGPRVSDEIYRQAVTSFYVSLAAMQTGVKLPTEPVSKKDGNVEMFGFELPMNLGDVWPHTAVTPTQWFLSTSPSLTKELAGKTPVAAGPACGSHCRVNFPALWDFAAHWLTIIPIGPNETEKADFALTLARSLGSLDFVSGEQSGQAHDTMHWTIKDAP